MKQTSEIIQVRRFRSNPIEVGLLCMISLIFLNSVYSLVYDHPDFRAAALTPMASQPTSEGRTLASVTSSSLMSVNFDCDRSQTGPGETTSATRIRVEGPICGFVPTIGDEVSIPPKIEITNKTNHNTATVFSDSHTGKFSTDYISLEAGENIILVEILTGSGKTISREILIRRS